MNPLVKPRRRRWPWALLASLALIVAAFLGPWGRPSGAVDALTVIAGPIEDAVYWVSDGLGDTWRAYIYLVDAREHAADVATENYHLHLQLDALRRLESENERLRGLLGMKARRPMRYLAARVVGQDILGEFRTVTLNLGRDDGVLLGSPVVDRYGVVGRVVELSAFNARVLLIIDPNSSIDSRITRTRAQSIVQGTTNRRELRCQFVFSLRTDDLREGDEIVTSGLDQRFPPGLRIGTVDSVIKSDIGIFQDAKIKPAADISRLEEVMIIVGEQVE